jgi:hypothetical protein
MTTPMTMPTTTPMTPMAFESFRCTEPTCWNQLTIDQYYQ